jgi:peptide deformylase
MNKIVPVTDIPKDIIDCPIDNLKVLYRTCLEMQLLCLQEGGVGLAAAQIGVPWRLFVVVDINSSKTVPNFRYFLNCEYIPIGDEKQLSVEGCLSLRSPGGEMRRFRVNRYRKIQLRGQELLTSDKLKLTDVDEMHEGEFAIILQHEQEHQRGILIDQIGEEISLW